MNRLGIVLSAAFIVLGIGSLPAAADDWTTCDKVIDGLAPGTGNAAAAACTRLITSGKAKGRDLSLAYQNRALAWLATGEHDRAIADLNEAVRLNPKDDEAFSRRAYVWYDKEEYDRAIADSSEAIRLNPKHSEAFVVRAKARLEKDDSDHAIADLSEAIRLKPKSPDAFSNRSLAWSVKGDYDRALTDSNEAVRLNPKSANAFASRADAWFGKGDYDRALADANQALRFNPKQADALSTRGHALLRKGSYDRAFADLDESVRLRPNDASAIYNRGRAYELKGDFSGALADYQAALALDPKDEYVALAAGRVQKRLVPKPVPDPKDSAAPTQTSVATTVPKAIPGGMTAASPMRAETRIALVIGNGGYANVAPLTNAKNDAEALAAVLRRIGFTKVTLQLDLSRDKLLDALGTFANEARRADWAVLYYAGHGIEIGGTNYLIPVDAKLASDRDVSFQAVELDKALDGAGGAKKIGIVMVDAPRENPFVKTMTRSMASTRSIGRGLAWISHTKRAHRGSESARVVVLQRL